MASNNSNTLVDEKLAVSLFLDSLLREPEIEEKQDIVEPEIQTEVEVVEEIATASVIVSDFKLEMPDAITEVQTKPEIKTQEQVIVETKVEPAEEIETTAVAKEKKEVAAITPEWENEPFQILLFDVAGLKLAVPLMELSGVIEWTDSVTEMPGHADFYMGILQHLNNKIAVIDTARMVLPADKLQQLSSEDPRQRVKHIVLIDDYRWGLACDNIGEVITLHPDEVRWRTSKTRRGWLAGTVIEHMCALLNSEGFSAMLEKGHTVTD